MDWNNVYCSGCGLVNDYTITLRGAHQCCNCNGCGKFLGNKPYPYDYRKITIPFGKYKDQFIHEIPDVQYFEWLIDNVQLKGNIKKAVLQKIGRVA